MQKWAKCLTNLR